MKTSEIALDYYERSAVVTLRKLLKKKPEAAALLFEGMARDSAVSLLLQAKQELEDLHTLTRAIVSAAGEIVKMDSAPADG